MKKVFPALWLLALLFSTQTAWAGEPRIAVGESDYNFGRLLKGEKLQKTFHFKNVGDAPLVVERVRTSCGCTAALLSAEELAPGESGEVTTTFDSTRFRGPVVKTIYLYTNDPKQQVTQFFLRGTVAEEIVLNPDRISLGPIPPDTPAKAKVTLTNKGKTPLILGQLRVTAKEFDARLSAAELPPEGATEVEITVLAPKGKSRISGYVLVPTNHPRNPEIRIPVSVFVAPTGS